MLSGVFGIVATNPGALFRFTDGAFDWFAHFRSHQSSKIVFLALEDLSSPRHPLFAFWKRRAAVNVKSVRGALKLSLNCSGVERFNGFDGFPGRGVNRCDWHCLLLDEL